MARASKLGYLACDSRTFVLYAWLPCGIHLDNFRIGPVKDDAMSDYTVTQGRSKPMSVQQIVKAAHFDYNPYVPLKYWLRTAGTLAKEVPEMPQTALASR